jgi:hypothetical protein
MRTLFAALVLSGFLTSCSQSMAGPRAEELRSLLGKTVREVATSLHVPESSLRAGDEPPGRFGFVSAYIPSEPLGRRLVIYVSRDPSVISPERKVSAADLLEKSAAGIAVSFPVGDERPDVVVGDVIAHYHMQP